MRVPIRKVALAASLLLVAAVAVLIWALRRPSRTEISLRIIPRAAHTGDLDTLLFYAKQGHGEAIQRLGDPRFKAAEPFLIELLSDDRRKVSAATALARIDLDRNLPRLTGLLEDQNPDIRYGAIEALRSIPRWKDEHAWKAARAVAAHLQDDGPVGGPCLANWPIGLTAHEALCELLAAPDKPAGHGSINWSKDRMARNAASWSTWFREHENRPVLSILLEQSRHPSARARTRAASQLSKYEDLKSVDRLVELLGDPDQEVPQRAASALRRLTQHSPPMKDPKTFSQVWHSGSRQAWEAWWKKERDGFQFR